MNNAPSSAVTMRKIRRESERGPQEQGGARISALSALMNARWAGIHAPTPLLRACSRPQQNPSAGSRLSMSAARLAAVLLLLGAATAAAAEVQSHGLWFERWLCDTFFNGHRPAGYTQ